MSSITGLLKNLRLAAEAKPDEQEAERQKEGGSFFYGFLIALAVTAAFWAFVFRA